MGTSGNSKTRDKQFVDVNLCAGAGGLALGLVKQGVSPLEFYDMDPGACETLRINVGKRDTDLDGRVIEGDLSQVEWLPNASNVGILAAGAPCQPFSMGGARKGHSDSRNLFPMILKAVRHLSPRAVLIENVRGLERGRHRIYLDYLLRQLRYPDLTPRNGEAWDDHDQRLSQHGSDKKSYATYRVKWTVLNAADFGVAQNRYRVFIIATATDLPEYRFPNPTHSKTRLLEAQAAGDYWERRGLHPDSSLRPTPEQSRGRERTIALGYS